MSKTLNPNCHRSPHVRFSHLSLITLALSLGLSLAACQQTISKALTEASQKDVILQGNLMFREDVGRLQMGMSKEEVKFVLGSPLITGSFEPARWYYMFYRNSQLPSETGFKPVVHFSGKQGNANWVEYWQSPQQKKAAEDEKDLTTRLRGSFVESKEGHLKGTKTAFYGRLELLYVKNSLASVDVYEQKIESDQD